MRASGSHSVTLRRRASCPTSALRGGFPAGDAVPYMERNLAAGLFHASASLGIAEAAAQRRSPRSSAAGAARATRATRTLAAESAIDLGVCARRARPRRRADRRARGRAPRRARLRRGAHRRSSPRRRRSRRSSTRPPRASSTARSRSSGGAGYRNGHPIARAYRDVRAGAFMNPLAAGRAYELIGQVALGLGSR